MPTLIGFCAGFPRGDNLIFWALLFVGLGVACASVLASLAYIVGLLRDQARTVAQPAFLVPVKSILMFVLSILGLFSAVVMVRVVKVNFPDISGLGLLAFCFGVLVTLIPHIVVARKYLRIQLNDQDANLG